MFIEIAAASGMLLMSFLEGCVSAAATVQDGACMIEQLDKERCSCMGIGWRPCGDFRTIPRDGEFTLGIT